MPDIISVRDSIAWSYANLARAHAAVKDGHRRYLTLHHMIRARLFKGLRTGTMQFGPLFDDERIKILWPTGCVHCGSQDAPALDHLVPRRRGGLDTGDNLVLACVSCNSRKGGHDLIAWHMRSGTFPSLMLLRRYLKLVAAYCDAKDILGLPLSEVVDTDHPFALSMLPHDFPPLADLVLWYPLSRKVEADQPE